MASLKTIEGKPTSTLVSGNMYFYQYIAEPTVAFYDAFPLIFMIRRKGTNFEGINFHYLSTERRLELFKLMKDFFSTDTVESDTRLLVKGFRRILLVSKAYRDAKVALHRYKFANIQSKIIMVEPKNWEYAIKEPVQKFFTNTGRKKASGSVWRKTLKQSKKG